MASCKDGWQEAAFPEQKAIDRNRIREYQLSPINTNNLLDEMRLFEEYLNSYNKSEYKRAKVAKSNEKKRF